MKLFVGKMPARCPGCGTNDWELSDTPQSFTVLTEVTCTRCRRASTYGDLALQAPLDADEHSQPES